MSKEAISRVSIPGVMLDLLWKDDEFYREVSSNKRVSSSGKFPRCDQWCDDAGFHMAFALAGYSMKDIHIEVCRSEVVITGTGSKLHSTGLKDIDKSIGDSDEYPSLTPNLAVQNGIIIRGIARRNFKLKFHINSAYSPVLTRASMKDGLLELLMPISPKTTIKTISIEGEL